MGVGTLVSDELYGLSTMRQPSAAPGVTHPAGTPEPFALTHPDAHMNGPLHDPVLWLVLLLGVGIVLVHLSVEGGLNLKVKA
jgi:hypothetical protein